MMICPEVYYEYNLKGKTIEAHKTAIRGLQIEMGILKKSMEEVYVSTDELLEAIEIDPSPSTVLWWTREYLKIVKYGLENIGGEYIPSKSELKAIKFQENIANIQEIIFSIGGYFQGHKTYKVQIKDDGLVVSIKDFDEEKQIKLLNSYGLIDKKCLLDAIEKLYIGEWKRNYSTLDMVCDGTQWRLEITYNNGLRKFKVDGDNFYPYNFDDLLELFSNVEEVLAN